jgi:hypothetical protein
MAEGSGRTGGCFAGHTHPKRPKAVSTAPINSTPSKALALAAATAEQPSSWSEIAGSTGATDSISQSRLRASGAWRVKLNRFFATNLSPTADAARH